MLSLFKFEADHPLGNISWLRFFKIDWWQFVGFVEGGRVANEYSTSELFNNWQTDIGVGLRSMMAGGVIRLDFAYSNEGLGIWAMVQHPF